MGTDIPRTSGVHSRGYPGQKLRSGRSKSWKNKHFGADIHDSKARTSTTLRDFQKLRSEKLWAEFSFPTYVPQFPFFRPRCCCFSCVSQRVPGVDLHVPHILWIESGEENWDDWLCQGWVWAQPKNELPFMILNPPSKLQKTQVCSNMIFFPQKNAFSYRKMSFPAENADVQNQWKMLRKRRRVRVARMKLARKICFEARIFSREMLRNFLRIF